MRKLGQVLGFEAMSLYNHVANKDDVLDGILDLVLGESEPPSPAGDWDAAIRASAISVHDALRRHPWSCTLLMSPGRVRPARLRYMDLLLGRLREAGFSAETTYTAYHVLDGHIFGFSLWETSHTYTAEEAVEARGEVRGRRSPPMRTRTCTSTPSSTSAKARHREVSAFEFGLDLILDGLEKLRDTA